MANGISIPPLPRITCRIKGGLGEVVRTLFLTSRPLLLMNRFHHFFNCNFDRCTRIPTDVGGVRVDNVFVFGESGR